MDLMSRLTFRTWSSNLDQIPSFRCHTDRTVLGDPTYVESLNMAYRESLVFKFADRVIVQFQCQIRLCVKDEGGCVGITVSHLFAFKYCTYLKVLATLSHWEHSLYSIFQGIFERKCTGCFTSNDVISILIYNISFFILWLLLRKSGIAAADVCRRKKRNERARYNRWFFGSAHNKSEQCHWRKLANPVYFSKFLHL